MKPLIWILFFSLSILAQSAKVIEPAKAPKDKNAGFVLALEEDMRITDDKGDFYFKRPNDIKVAPDGTLFICDGSQLLTFDAQGKFLANIIKTGEGPGEVKRFFRYKIKDKKVYVFDALQKKMIVLDYKGKLIDEFLLNKIMGIKKILTIEQGHYYFLNSKFPEEIYSEKEGVFYNRNFVMTYKGEGKATNSVHNFPTGFFKTRKSIGPIDSIVTLLVKDRFLYVYHGGDYKIKVLDIFTDKIVNEFGRVYKSKKFYLKDASEEAKRELKYLIGRDLSDINRFYQYKDQLWVVTSTSKKDRSILFDVFSLDGEYLTNFYLHYKFIPKTVHKNKIYTVQSGEDKNIFVARYKVKNL